MILTNSRPCLGYIVIFRLAYKTLSQEVKFNPKEILTLELLLLGKCLCVESNSACPAQSQTCADKLAKLTGFGFLVKMLGRWNRKCLLCLMLPPASCHLSAVHHLSPQQAGLPCSHSEVATVWCLPGPSATFFSPVFLVKCS